MFPEAGAGGGSLVYANGTPVAFPNMMPFIAGPEGLGFPHMVSSISFVVNVLNFHIFSVENAPVVIVYFESS